MMSDQSVLHPPVLYLSRQIWIWILSPTLIATECSSIAPGEEGGRCSVLKWTFFWVHSGSQTNCYTIIPRVDPEPSIPAQWLSLWHPPQPWRSLWFSWCYGCWPMNLPVGKTTVCSSHPCSRGKENWMWGNVRAYCDGGHGISKLRHSISKLKFNSLCSAATWVCKKENIKPLGLNSCRCAADLQLRWCCLEIYPRNDIINNCFIFLYSFLAIGKNLLE